MSDPRANNVLVETLGTSLRYGGSALSDAPGLLKRLLTDGAWCEFVTRRGEHVQYERFADFVTTPPLKGLGSDMALVRRIVGADDEATRLLREASKEKPGPKGSRDNVMGTSQGNDRSYALQRLERDAPELHAEVLAGNLSAHGAMVKAGYRPRTISVPVGKPEAVAHSLLKYMSADDIAKLIAVLIGKDG